MYAMVRYLLPFRSIFKKHVKNTFPKNPATHLVEINNVQVFIQFLLKEMCLIQGKRKCVYLEDFPCERLSLTKMNICTFKSSITGRNQVPPMPSPDSGLQSGEGCRHFFHSLIPPYPGRVNLLLSLFPTFPKLEDPSLEKQ